eukprot:1158846-Ditylum_brightwellii.AAC.1
MVCKKSSPQRKNQTPMAKGDDVKVKVTINNVEESSATVLMTVMNSSTDVGAVDDRRKKHKLTIVLLHLILMRCYRTRMHRLKMKRKMKRTITLSAVPIWQYLSQS